METRINYPPKNYYTYSKVKTVFVFSELQTVIASKTSNIIMDHSVFLKKARTRAFTFHLVFQEYKVLCQFWQQLL